MQSDREKELAKELKSLCIQHGTKWKETNPQKSAKIFHELGSLCQDKYLDKTLNSLERKFAFIQSATLLNGAFARDPLEEIRKDLKTLCSELLKAAGASNQEFHILEYSDLLKNEIEEWRMNLKEDAKKITFVPEGKDENTSANLQKNKVEDIETLQTQITERYKSLMVKVSETCISILGEAPCQYALVGMGLMARKEVTPYSDFENMILLQQGVELRDKDEYSKIKEYFRWYTAIFQVILINLGETDLPSVAIPSINDCTGADEDWFFDAFSKRGISYSGIMPCALKYIQPHCCKVSEAELIKPVNEMVRYLGQEENLKNGYHLADILTSTCLVAGDECLYKSFEVCVRNETADAPRKPKLKVIDAMKTEMKTYRKLLKALTSLNSDSDAIKQFVFRSITILTTRLAKMQNMNKGTCFEMVRRMRDHNLVIPKFACKLQYALAVAFEIRMKTCLSKHCQMDSDDFTFDQKQNISFTDFRDVEDLAADLIKAVGKQSCYDFFEIAHCLQYDVTLCFNDVVAYCPPIMLCTAISSFLNLYDRIVAVKLYEDAHPYFSVESSDDERNSSASDIDSNVSDNISSRSADKNGKDNQASSSEDHCINGEKTDVSFDGHDGTADAKDTASSCGEVDTHYKEVVRNSDGDAANEDRSSSIGDTRSIGSECAVKSDVASAKCKENDAGDSVEVLKDKDAVTGDDDGIRDGDSSKCDVVESSPNEVLDSQNAALSKPLVIGSWYFMMMQKFNEKQDSFKASLDFGMHGLKLGAKNQHNAAQMLFEFGKYLCEKSYYHYACCRFRTALKCLHQQYGYVKSMDAAKCLFWFGKCLRYKGKYEKAFAMLQDALNLYESLSDGEKVEENFECGCLMEIAVCQQEMFQYEASFDTYKKAFKLYESLKDKNDDFVMVYLLDCGICLNELRKYEDAKLKFEELLEICAENAGTSCAETNHIRALCDLNLGRCLKNLGVYDSSADH